MQAVFDNDKLSPSMSIKTFTNNPTCSLDNLSKHKCKSAFSLACLVDSYFSLNSFLSCTWRLTPAFMPLVASFASDSSLTDSLGSDTDTDKLRTESSFVQQV